MRKSMRNSLVVGGLAALGLSAWLLKSGGSISQAAPAPKAAAAISATPGATPNAKEQARLLANVQNVVKMRNHEAREQRRAFEADGWEVTQGGTPPDDRLVGYDPKLLKDREAELREQISSTTAKPEDAHNLAQIATQAKELETRWHAVESLYRIAGEEGQKELFGLLRDGGLAQTDQARSLIAPRLQPESLDTSYAADLARLLDSPTLLPVEKVQIATNLAILALRDGTSLSPQLIASLSPASQALLAERLEWVKNELPKAWANTHANAHQGR